LFSDIRERPSAPCQGGGSPLTFRCLGLGCRSCRAT
jgi:hypothetical protein